MQLPDKNPTPYKKVSHLPGLIIVSVFLLASLAANVYLAYSLVAEGKLPEFTYQNRPEPTPTPTPPPSQPNWKQITLDELTFDYPADWHATFSTIIKDSQTLTLNPSPIYQDLDQASSLIHIENIQTSTGSAQIHRKEKLVSQFIPSLYKNIAVNTSKSDYGQITHITATHLIGENYNRKINQYIITPINSTHLYIFSLTPNENKDYAKVYEKMVESVKTK